MVLLLFISGMILSSFYMVVAMRLPNNESIIKPGSHCEYCHHSLKWYDLIPLFSYIISLGKCRYCHKKISFLYPLIELIGGLLFALGYCYYGISYELYAYLIIVSLLIIIFISDFKYYIILDSPIYIGSILILILKYFYFGFNPFIKSIISGLVIFIFMYGIKLIGDKVFKRECLGGGDIKLSLFIGVVLGIRLGFTSLVIGSIIALPFAIYVVLKCKEKEIPYGPFLIAAVYFSFIFMNQINFIINTLFLMN